MRRQFLQRWLVGITAVLPIVITPNLAFAQGCAMCYSTTAASRAAIQALRSGIVVLLIPPVLIFGTVCVLALRNRNRFNDGGGAADHRT